MVPSKWSPRGTGSCSPPDTERLSKPEVPDGGSREITSVRTGADRTSDSLLSRKFRELRQREVRRIPLPRTSVNRDSKPPLWDTLSLFGVERHYLEGRSTRR